MSEQGIIQSSLPLMARLESDVLETGDSGIRRGRDGSELASSSGSSSGAGSRANGKDG